MKAESLACVYTLGVLRARNVIRNEIGNWILFFQKQFRYEQNQLKIEKEGEIEFMV